MRRLLLATLASFALAAGPARANCADSYVDAKDFAPAAAQGLAALKAGPDAACVDRLADGLLYLTPAFDGLAAARKKELLKAAYGAMWKAQGQEAIEQRTNSGYVAAPVRVADAAGRPLYIQTPCFGSFTLLTERERHVAMYSFGTSDEKEFRTQTHPLPKGIDLATLRKRLGAVSRGAYLGWAPEGGFFELDLPRATDQRKLAAFWARAPRHQRYEVRLVDGTLLSTVQR